MASLTCIIATPNPSSIKHGIPKKASSIAELDDDTRIEYDKMIDELRDLDDLSEEEKAVLSIISGKLKTVDVSAS